MRRYLDRTHHVREGEGSVVSPPTPLLVENGHCQAARPGCSRHGSLPYIRVVWPAKVNLLWGRCGNAR